MVLTRKETADYLQISMDALRNWEMNGLLTIKRKQNGYRIYTDEDIRRLKVIRSLRCANYSLSAILRMLNTLSQNPKADIRQVIDTPDKSDDIISVCDKLLTSLHYAEENAEAMLAHLKKMKKNDLKQTLHFNTRLCSGVILLVKRINRRDFIAWKQPLK